jgi:hypothetical protein
MKKFLFFLTVLCFMAITVTCGAQSPQVIVRLSDRSMTMDRDKAAETLTTLKVVSMDDEILYNALVIALGIVEHPTKKAHSCARDERKRWQRLPTDYQCRGVK